MFAWCLGKPKTVNCTCEDQGDTSRQDQLIQNAGVYNIYWRGFEQQPDCNFCLLKIKTRSLLMYCCPWYTPTEQMQQLGIDPLVTIYTSSPLMHPGNDPIKEEFKTGRQRGSCSKTVCRLPSQSLWGQFCNLQNRGNVMEILNVQ